MSKIDIGICDTTSLKPLKALLSCSHSRTRILLFSDGKRLGKALLRLNKKKFWLVSHSPEYDIRSLEFTGRVVVLFAGRDVATMDPLSTFFCRSDGDLHIHALCKENRVMSYIEHSRKAGGIQWVDPLPV